MISIKAENSTLSIDNLTRENTSRLRAIRSLRIKCRFVMARRIYFHCTSGKPGAIELEPPLLGF